MMNTNFGCGAVGCEDLVLSSVSSTGDQEVATAQNTQSEGEQPIGAELEDMFKTQTVQTVP